jgi:Polysaccharide biosynthesis enzyme WcbI
MKKFTILGNCQISPLAKSLEFMSDQIKVILQKVTLTSLEFSVSEIRLIQESDFVLLVERTLSQYRESNAFIILSESRIIEVPSITFTAFHPDTVYARLQDGWLQNGIESDWQSSVVLAGYSKEVSPNILSKLILTSELFDLLGYSDRWLSSCDLLEQEFESRQFDFQRWLNSVRRSGVFMWGLNHPKLHAVAELSIQILEKMELGYKYFPEIVAEYVSDPLSNTVWPVYPKIASQFAYSGSDIFRHNTLITNLETFIKLSYKKWKNQNLNTNEIQLIGSEIELGTIVETLGREF